MKRSTSALTPIFFAGALLLAELSNPMIIRHDIDPENYIADEANFPVVFPVIEDGNLKECVATLADCKAWA